MDGNFDVAVDKLIRYWCPTLEDKELKWVHQLDFGEWFPLPPVVHDQLPYDTVVFALQEVDGGHTCLRWPAHTRPGIRQGGCRGAPRCYVVCCRRVVVEACIGMSYFMCYCRWVAVVAVVLLLLVFSQERTNRFDQLPVPSLRGLQGKGTDIC